MKLPGALALGLLAGSAAAAPLPRYGVFVFSSLCTEQDSGDVGGARLTLTRTKDGDTLVYEYGNGGLNASKVKGLTIDDDRLSADASTGDGDVNLSATLDDGGATLVQRFYYEKSLDLRPSTLPRIRGRMGKLPACGA